MSQPSTLRRSSSLRADQVGSPAPRSRSQERRTISPTPVTSIQYLGGAPGDEEFDHDETKEDSLRVASNQDKAHRRAMSDPFDSNADDNGGVVQQIFEGSDKNDGTPAAVHETSTIALPTLPRYPVAATRDLNCFSEPPVKIFHVRGPNYLEDRKKITSGPYLLRARGCDLFLTENPPADIAKNPNILGGSLHKAPTFLVNFRFPWGVLVLYFEVPAKLAPFLVKDDSAPKSMDGFSPAERTLVKYFQAPVAEKNASLKLIPYIAEGPWIVRNMVTGTPAIIGNKLPVTYCCGYTGNSKTPYLEADLDIGNSSSTARRIVSVCRRYMNSLTLDVGFVIQGNTHDELPEQMLGSVRVHGADPLKAPTL